MSRKHYVAVAAMLRVHISVSGDQEAAGMREVARSLATLFADDNPRFDRARFLAACGVQS